MTTSTLVPGLSYIDSYLTEPEQQALITAIDSQAWITDFKRRVQHYGYRYDYKARAVHDTMRLGDLPDWLSGIAIRLRDDGWISEIPDQAIINEYLPGQGIAPHIDCIPCFSDTILSISLSSVCIMTFTRLDDPIEVPLLLKPSSLTVMRGESRYAWKHGIAPRKSDTLPDHGTFQRGRRLSVTFRKVVL